MPTLSQPASKPPVAETRRPVIAFGPEMPDWGSWQWLGEGTIATLSDRFTSVRFGWNEVPECDVLVLVKHLPPPDFLQRLSDRTAVVYCPVDFFGSRQQIAASEPFLRRCQRIVVHCDRLRRYFEPYAAVESMDHPVKFITRRPVSYRESGCLLWVGVWGNLAPLVAWLADHPLPHRLRVLTNFEAGRTGDPAEFGFPAGQDVVVERWTAERQLELMRSARAAIDIKGTDFRQRHKPPAKGLDFIASGLPLAMNPDSSTAEHLARLGFDLADPLDAERWFSREYWKETRRLATMLRELLSPQRIARRFERIIEQVLDERPGTSAAATTARVEHVTVDDAGDAQTDYPSACRLAEDGKRDKARRLLETLRIDVPDNDRRALIENDLAVLAAVDGDINGARSGFESALALSAACKPARTNLAMLPSTGTESPIKVAILSFLFNWPSTGGGIVHTVELAQFLARAGYEVQHVYAKYEPWGIGKVERQPPFSSQALAFDESHWSLAEIQRRYREAVEAFDPDCVILTDSWNFKPRLAEAIRGFPYILRFQALECLCPLNNVRLLPGHGGGLRQCERNQLADPQACRQCLADLAARSGGLHQVERALSGVGTDQYDRLLREAYRNAEAVFVVNPPTAELVAPFSRRVVVSPAGMAPGRFPWPWQKEPIELRTPDRLMIFFAGLVQETIKGFHVLHEACRRLFQRRQDFELVATGDPPGRVDHFTRFVGWQSQEDLPRCMRAADVCAVPAVAQEALGRTAVEAMAAGRPVVASRLGGLPTTIEDGVTGLLCEGGDPDDLARKIEVLLDDPQLRQRMGDAGRKRFDERFRWDVLIERDYRPVLRRRVRMVDPT